MEVYVDDEAKLTLNGLQQHYVKLKENEKNKKLFELLDVLEFNQVCLCKLEQSTVDVNFFYCGESLHDDATVSYLPVMTTLSLLTNSDKNSSKHSFLKFINDLRI